MPRRRPRRARVALASVTTATAVLTLAACGTTGGTAASPPPSDVSSSAAGGADLPAVPPGATQPDPDDPTGWGPTEGELADARELVSGWDDDRLAGQVIVGRYDGTDPAVPATMVRELHLAGVCVTSDNVTGADQVRATTAAVQGAVADDGRDVPAVIGVDEEGGPVAHLRGVASDLPAFEVAGSAIQGAGRTGRRDVVDVARASGLELRDLGFTWVFAPVADVTIGAADPTIGPRSASEDPRTAARAVGAAVRGYEDAGVVSTPKHFPGHGAVTTDSHLALPVLDRGRAGLQRRELPPFRAAVRQGAPVVMVGHIQNRVVSPDGPASLAASAYDFLRDDLGFDGVAITDSLGMGAVAGHRRVAVQALRAGADLLLMPADSAVAHHVVSTALRTGRLGRSRVEEAAARVLALQAWQQRVAGSTPVPDDPGQLVDDAVARLEADSR